MKLGIRFRSIRRKMRKVSRVGGGAADRSSIFIGVGHAGGEMKE
jgi:hypothetical protein